MSVSAYVQSLVADCSAQVIDILGECGPLTYSELRRALRMEQHVAQAIIDRSLADLTRSGRIVGDDTFAYRLREL